MCVKLSVIMANRNYGHWLEQSVNAIMEQSYEPFEVILLDDASTDDSTETLKPRNKDVLGKFIQIAPFTNQLSYAMEAIRADVRFRIYEEKIKEKVEGK